MPQKGPVSSQVRRLLSRPCLAIGGLTCLLVVLASPDHPAHDQGDPSHSDSLWPVPVTLRDDSRTVLHGQWLVLIRSVWQVASPGAVYGIRDAQLTQCTLPQPRPGSQPSFNCNFPHPAKVCDHLRSVQWMNAIPIRKKNWISTYHQQIIKNENVKLYHLLWYQKKSNAYKHMLKNMTKTTMLNLPSIMERNLRGFR